MNDQPQHPDELIAVEPPKILLKHPDVRIETIETQQVVHEFMKESRFKTVSIPNMIYVLGCHKCQKIRSKCSCETPEITERWVYNRERGVINRTTMALIKER
jgi:hypothetical protein